MRTLFVGLCVLGLAAWASPAAAEIGTPDVVPAATLLLPYFAVDLSNPNGLTTLVSINNASDEVVVAHVTLWSEWWVPVLAFDVYLTGYDVHTLNLRDILVNGNLPNTGPSNALSPLGAFSTGPHDPFGGSCGTTAGTAPNYFNLAGMALQVLQQSLTGQPRVTDGLCASAPGNETLARGYVTIDLANACADQFPDHVNYFQDGGVGTAANQNVLWGDYFLVDPANNFAQGFTLVHVEADGGSLGVADGACDNDEVGTDRSPTTFYCSFANPAGAAGEDNREGLPSAYATRYLLGGPFDGGTDLIVWRDVNRDGGLAPGPQACLAGPAPLGQQQLVAFDEQENPLLGGPAPTTPFPFGTNRAVVGTDFSVGASFGWLFLNLNTGGSAPDTFRQAHVTTVLSALGRYSVGYEAFPLNNLTLGADNRRGPRNADPTLGPAPNPGAPTLFDGTP